MDNQEKTGTWIGLVIIIVILVLGGIYIWKPVLENKEGLTPPSTESVGAGNELINEDIESLNEAMDGLDSLDVNMETEVENLE